MDQRKKAIGIFAVGLAFIITAVGVFFCGFFIGKNSKVIVVNTAESNVTNTAENNTKKVKEYSDKEIMSYKYKVSYSPKATTALEYKYNYEVNFETNEITKDWIEMGVFTDHIRYGDKDTVKMDNTTKYELIEILKKFDISDWLYGKKDEAFDSQKFVEIKESPKEITYSFREQDNYGLIKKLEDIFKK